MSWKKKKKEIGNFKHKAKLMICLMFAVVIGLVIFLGFRIVRNNSSYKIDSRVKNLKKTISFKDSSFTTVGWLKIQGTSIDMPIIRSDNIYEDFPVELENFAWTTNNDGKHHTNINIVGHNIFNLSAHPKIKSNYFHRLEELMAFTYYDFAKNNQYIQYTIDGKDYVYKIYAVEFLKASEKTSFPRHDDYTKEEIKKWSELYKKYSIYDYDVDVVENDKLITLSTCTRFFGKDADMEFYVMGRLLREDEKPNLSKVSKNKNYKKIEKILKGDDNNEESDL